MRRLILCKSRSSSTDLFWVRAIFNMNEQTIKGKENTEARSPAETRVDTIDHWSSPGRGQELRNVQVIHQAHSPENSTTSSGVLGDAVAAVASTIQSAKDAYSRK